MLELEISYIDYRAPEYHEVWQLRENVLRIPLGMSLKNENLDMDAGDTIFIAKYDGAVIACLMLHHIGDPVVKFRQMAVDAQWQGKGVGARLIAAAEAHAVSKGYSTVILHARQVVCGFYESQGYYITSSVFTEVGIPHVIMKKDLTEA